MVAGRWLSFRPSSNNAPLAVSTVECTPSATIAELPVTLATMNLVTAIAMLAAIAAKMGSLVPATKAPHH